MAYSTLDDVRVAVGGTRNLIELADLEDTAALAGGLTDPLVIDVVDRAIGEADGIINAYLKQRSAIPLVAVPPEISAMSSSWAARVLRRNRYKQQPIAEDQAAEKVDRDYLKGVAAGTIQLGVTPTPAKSSLIVDKAAPRAATLATSNERLKDFI